MSSIFRNFKGYLYLFKDKLRYGWQKKEYRYIVYSMNNIGDAHAERTF